MLKMSERVYGKEKPVQQKVDFSAIKESAYGAVTATGEIVKSINDIKPGQKFGKLTIIKELPKIDSKRRWLTYCDCGNVFVVFGYQLLSNGVKSCGCEVKKRKYSAVPTVHIGDRFGRLTVTGFAGRAKEGQRLVTCKCDCGTEKNYRLYSLLSGNTRSCGCLLRDITILKNLHAGITADDIMDWTPEQIQEFCAKYKNNKEESKDKEVTNTVQTPQKNNVNNGRKRRSSNYKMSDIHYKINRANSVNRKEIKNISAQITNLANDIRNLYEMNNSSTEQMQSLMYNVADISSKIDTQVAEEPKEQGFWGRVKSCFKYWFS